jgi:hypothetical protein
MQKSRYASEAMPGERLLPEGGEKGSGSILGRECADMIAALAQKKNGTRWLHHEGIWTKRAFGLSGRVRSRRSSFSRHARLSLSALGYERNDSAPSFHAHPQV